MNPDSKGDLSVNIPETDKPRIVIIGGGFGGINLLRHLDTTQFQLVLLDRNNYHTFQPLLYQVATAGLEPGSTAGPLRQIIRRKKGVYFRMLHVDRIDPENRVLHTPAGDLHYDILVIATGSQTDYFGNDDIAEHAYPLKSISNALDLRSYLFEQFEKSEIITDEAEQARLMTFAVVGAGPTGVELCGALAELRKKVLPVDYPDLDVEIMQIHLIEGLERILPGMSEKSSKKAHRYLEKMGVNIVLNTLTSHYDGHTVTLDSGEHIEANTLIWAAGVKGNPVAGLDERSIEKSRLLVDAANRVLRNPDTGCVHKNIFAIGDVAHMKHPDYPDGVPGLAQAAIQQARQLAENLHRLNRNRPMKNFHYRNKGVLATIGRNKALADLPGGIKMGGMPAWMVWMMVHLLFLIGFRNKAVVLTNWIWNYFTYDRGIRLIINRSTRKREPASEELVEDIGAIGARDDRSSRCS